MSGRSPGFPHRPSTSVILRHDRRPIGHHRNRLRLLPSRHAVGQQRGERPGPHGRWLRAEDPSRKPRVSGSAAVQGASIVQAWRSRLREPCHRTRAPRRDQPLWPPHEVGDPMPLGRRPRRLVRGRWRRRRSARGSAALVSDPLSHRGSGLDPSGGGHRCPNSARGSGHDPFMGEPSEHRSGVDRRHARHRDASFDDDDLFALLHSVDPGTQVRLQLTDGHIHVLDRAS